MRDRFAVIVVFALLLMAPAALHAQPSVTTSVPPAQPPPCAVPADDSWSEQERLVWRRVCAGEVADFEKEPDYGDSIDPKSGALPAKRVLRARFIETILKQDKFFNTIRHRGLRITGAWLMDRLDLGNAEVAVQLWFERCRFDQGADLSWLKTAQPIAFNNSRVGEKLTFYAAQIGSDLHVQDSVIGTIVLTAAHVARTLDLERTQVVGDADLIGLDVGTNIQMKNAKLGGLLQMEGLRVGVFLDLQYSALQSVKLTGARAQQISFEGTTVRGDIDMSAAQVGGDLLMATAQFFDELRLRNMQVGGQLDWSGTSFHKNVDLTGARIGGELRLNHTEWRSATLTARFAKIGIIPYLAAPWPRHLDIDGLTYDGLQSPDASYGPWFDRMTHYSRQPYEQLAKVLQAQGEISRATEVRYAEREADRNRSNQRWYIYAWLTLLKWMIGYGYYPYYALAWIVVLVLIGAVVLRVSGEGPKNQMPWGLAYSFDMLVPVIRLRDRHNQVDIASNWRYYFYFHRIMGWVLASFLVAGISGLTK